MPKRCRKPTAVSLLLSLAVMITPMPATGAGMPEPAVPLQARWAPWRDLLEVPSADLPQAVARNLRLPIQGPRCADVPSIVGVAGCVASYAALAVPRTEAMGPADDATRSLWLSALSELLRVAQSLPPSAAGQGVQCLDPACRVQIGGPGNDTYTVDAAVIVDSGGNDTYLNNAGGAVGTGGTRVALLVDQGSGDDTYAPVRTDLYGATTIGSGSVGGIGLLVDEGGSDRYSGLGGTMGTGFSGAGMLLDRGAGPDVYLSPYPTDPGSIPGQSHKAVIGAASWGGFGFVVDEGGDDSYTQYGVDSLGWGATGGVGLLLDRSGNDAYRSHPAPTDNLTGDFFELHSGVSIGVGEVGGTGVLLDGSGDDAYECSGAVHYGCIGDSHFGGELGLVYDDSGNDSYTLGTKLTSEQGHIPSGLGSGYLNGLGVLVDASGDDRYTSRAAQSGGYGSMGGAGLLADLSGADAYSFSEPPLEGERRNGSVWVGGMNLGFMSATGAGVDV